MSFYRLILIKLSSQGLGYLLEVLLILVTPPVFQVAIAIVFCSAIVKAVAHLMANYCPYTPEVHRRIGIKTKERRLENGRREYDLIIHRIVIRIDCLRGHSPAGFIHFLADLFQLFLVTPSTYLADILIIRRLGSWFYHKAWVVLPLIGIAYLYTKLTELYQGLFFRLLRHPREVFDMLGKTTLEVVDEYQHLLFCLSWEIFFYI